MTEQNFSSLNTVFGNTFNTSQFQANKTLECSFDLANIKKELNAKLEAQTLEIATLKGN
jgi:hypothetical protein